MSNFGSSQHSPASLGGRPNLQYLSPPIDESDDETPPYKPAADDNVSLNMHRSSRRKRKRKHRHGQHSVKRERESRPSDLYPISESHGPKIEARSIKSGESNSEDSDGSEIPAYKTLKSLSSERPLGQRPWWRLKNGAYPRAGAGAPQDFEEGVQNRWAFPRRNSQDQAHQNRLNKPTWDMTNYALIAKDERRESLLGIPVLPSASFITAFAASSPPSQSPTPDTTTVKGKIPETPATITLRKASGVHSNNLGKRSQRHGNPASAPIQTYSSALNEASNSSVGHPGAYTENAPTTSPNRSILEGRRILSEAETRANIDVEFFGTPHRANTADRLCAFSGQQRHSLVVDPALTFADIQAGPRTFSVTTKSRKHSLLAKGALRRASITQICSRNSFHEIIWKDDDTPSSWSSGSPQSLHYSAADSSSIEDTANEDDPVELGSGPKTSLGAEIDTSNMVTPATVPDVALQSSQPGRSLFDWSWHPQEHIGPRREAIMTIKSDEVTPPEKLERYEVSSKRPRGGHKRKSVSDVPSVESFPPLPERRSTSEWRKSPLIDLSDPFAGRERSFKLKDTEVGELHHKEKHEQISRSSISQIPRNSDMSEAQRKKSIVRQHLFAPPRMGEDSKVGCSIGTSSHMRRNSGANHQQRESVHFTDMVKLQLRRASELMWTSAEDALRLQAGQTDAITDRQQSVGIDPFSGLLHPPAIMDSTQQSLPLIQPTLPPWKQTDLAKERQDRLRVDVAGMTTTPIVTGTADSSGEDVHCSAYDNTTASKAVSVDWIG